MRWTDDSVELLRKLWSKGFSASQIAERIGGVSRNAVIGKIYRLGLSGRATVHRSRHRRSQNKLVATMNKAGLHRGQRTDRTAGAARKALFDHEVAKHVAAGDSRAVATSKAAAAMDTSLGVRSLTNDLNQSTYNPTFVGDQPMQLSELSEELVIPLSERKTILQLVEASCRWPIGDPQHKDFHFCGKQKVPCLPYCEFHARRAYLFVDPSAPRRGRKERKAEEHRGHRIVVEALK